MRRNSLLGLTLFCVSCSAAAPVGVKAVEAAIGFVGVYVVTAPVQGIAGRTLAYRQCLEAVGAEPSEAQEKACCKRWLEQDGARCAQTPSSQ